jgi:hypothetical protein
VSRRIRGREGERCNNGSRSWRKRERERQKRERQREREDIGDLLNLAKARKWILPESLRKHAALPLPLRFLTALAKRL